MDITKRRKKIFRRLFLKAMGFTREAHFRENHFYNGKFYDTEVYGLIKWY